MSVDISTLAIEVRSDGVLVASDRLRRLPQDGAAAERATNSLSAAFGNLNKYLGQIAGMFGMGLGIAGFVSLVRNALDVIDEFRVSMLQIAVQITQMQGPKDIAKHYAEAKVYAAGLVDKLMEIDAVSFASNDHLMSMVKTMGLYGVQLDLNNKRQVEAFTALSNTIALGTQGQNQNIQFPQEMRAIMTGNVTTNSVIATQLDGIIKQSGTYKKGLDDIVRLGKQHGNTLELLEPYLKGISIASDDISKTWSAVKSSMSTAASVMKREGFAGVFADVVPLMSRINDYLKSHAKLIGQDITKVWIELKFWGEKFYDTLKLIAPVAKVAWDIFKELYSTVKAIADTPLGWVALVGAAAFKAVGGIAALAGGWATLTTSVVALNVAMTANPLGLMAKGIALVAIGLQPVITKLDSMLYKMSGINLTGKAFYEDMKKREADAIVSENNLKAKLKWMHDEGGIKLSDSQKAYAGVITTPVLPAPKPEENKKKMEEIARLEKSIIDARITMNAAQRALDAAGEKQATDDKIALMNWEKEQGVRTARETIDGISALKRKALEDDVARNQEYQNDTEMKKALGYSDNGNTKQTLEYIQAKTKLIQLEEKEKDLKAQLASLDVTTNIEREKDNNQIVIDQIRDLNELYQAQLNIKKELETMQANNDAVKASLVGTNDTGGFDSIADQIANQLAVQQQAHDARLKMIDDERKASISAVMAEGKSYETHLIKMAKLDDKAALEKQQNDKTTTKISQSGFTSQISMLGNYAAIASQLFSGMASAQDQSSRAGFESAKMYSLGAAIMSTAAAIIGQLTGPDAWTPAAWARSAVAGILGAMQVAQIASTSYGGGGSVSNISAGSYIGGSSSTGGTVGGSIGTQYNTVGNSRTEEQLQEIAGSMENASLAIGRVADSLTDVAELFTDGSFLSMVAGTLPTESTANGDPGWMMGGWRQTQASADAFFTSIWRGFTFDIEDFFSTTLNTFTALLGGSEVWGGNQSIQGQGMALGLNSGQSAASNYIQIKTDGGWFGSDSTSTNYSNNAGIANAVQLAIDQIVSTISRASVALGTTSNASLASLGTTLISTSGRSAEDISADLENWLVSASNELAKTVVGLQDFAFYGENAFDALVRLSTALQSSNEAFELIGASLVSSTLESANAMYKLQDMMGGAEAFTDAVDTYFTSMFTDEEQAAAKAAQAARQVSVVFAEMGVDAPDSKAGFRGLVNSLDVTTEAGAQTFAALMNISEAFALVQDHAADLQTSMDDLLTDTLTYTTDLLTQAMDTAADNLRAALDVAKSATAQLITLRGGNLSPENNYLELKTAFTTAVASNDTDTILRIASQYAAASKAYNASGSNYVSDYNQIEQALVGLTGMEDTSDLSLQALNAHTTYLQNIDDTISGQSDLMNTNNGALASLNVLMATYVQNQQALVQANQLAYDSRVGTAASSLSAINGAGSVASLAGVLNQMATGAINNPFDIDSTIVSFAQSVAEGTGDRQTLTDILNTRISNYFTDYIKDGVVTTDTTVSTPTTSISPDEIDNAMASVAVQYFADLQAQMLNNTWSTDLKYDIAHRSPTGGVLAGPGGSVDQSDYYMWSWLKNGTKRWSELGLPASGIEWSGIPGFASGTSYVPYDMMANIHQGEIIMDRGSSDTLRKYGIPMYGSADNKELVAEIKELRKEVAKQGESNIRLQQTIGVKLIDVNEQQAKRLEGVEKAALLERAA